MNRASLGTIKDVQHLLPSKPDFKEFMLAERRKAEAGTLGKLAVLELFAGIGAPHSALSRSHPGKFAVLDVVEIWSKAVEAYNLLYGTNYDTQDVRTWFWEFDIRFDLVFHGSPCQDFSAAGKNKGGEKGSGTRSATLWETDDIVRNRLKKRPKVVIWENVKGALSGSNRKVFDAYVADLAGMGYNTKFEVLNSKDFGIPQSRNRVFAISILNEFAEQFADFSFDKLVRKPYKPAKYYLETEVDEKYFISETAPSMVKAIANGKIKLIDGIVQTVTTKQDRWNSAGVVPYSIDAKNFTNFVTIPNAQGKLINGNYNRAWKTDDTTGTIAASVITQVIVPIDKKKSDGNVIDTKEYTNFAVLPNADGKVINGSYNRAWKTSEAVGSMTPACIPKVIVPITGYVMQDKMHSTDNVLPTIGTGLAMRPNIIVPITKYDQQNRLHNPEGTLPTIGAENAQRPRILVPVDPEMPKKVKVEMSTFDMYNDIYNANDDTIPTIGTQPAMRHKLYVPVDKVDELPPKVEIPMTSWNHQNEIVNANGETMPTLGVRDGMRPRMFIPIDENGKRKGNKVHAYINENGQYVVAGIVPGKAVFNVNGILCHARRITPREAWRYMDFYDYQYDKIQAMSENNQYKMAGNSIVVSVLAELFDKLFYGWKQAEVR